MIPKSAFKKAIDLMYGELDSRLNMQEYKVTAIIMQPVCVVDEFDAETGRKVEFQIHLQPTSYRFNKPQIVNAVINL